MNNTENQYDAIIIGSGLGGLSTAGLLSKVNKKKVLILEKHYELGGLTHEFKRGQYSWDIGLHYIGNMHKRLLDLVGLSLFKYITNGKMKWNKMPNPFEKFKFPDHTIEIKESKKEFKKELIKKFPHQKKEIKRYIRDIHNIRLWYLILFYSYFFHPPMSKFFKYIVDTNNKKALMTTSEYLNKYITDNKLRAVLAARWGNYGVPPTDSAFAVHALIEHHYLTGGMFPDGGAEKIAIYIEETIEDFGGKTLINREVNKIIMEKNKAIGVEVKNMSDPSKKIEKYFAPIIVSNIGVQNTYNKLLPKSLNLPIQKKLKNFYPGYSAVDLYLGLKESPESLGLKGENYWIVDGYELDLFNNKKHDLLEGKAYYAYLSFPSMKSGKPGGHTADIVTILPYEFFEKWEGKYWKERSNEYYKIKEQITQNLLNIVDKYIPGFSNLVVYKEMSTPLTFKHFTSRVDGTFYGLPAVPERLKMSEIKVETPIKGLYLTGTDILSNGIIPALFSGMATVSYLNGPAGALKVILKSLFYRSPKKNKSINNINMLSKHKQSEDKAFAVLMKKTKKSKNMIELTFKFDRELKFIPGQHIKLLVGESEWRAYSIAKVDEYLLTLMIDTRPGGHGSNYAINIKIHDRALFRLPISDLIYHKSENDLIFIATGTGIVPFLHILDELKQQNAKHKVKVIFGCLKDEDNYIDEYLKPYEKYFKIEKTICVDKPTANSKNFKGQVTDLLKKKKYNFKNSDIYICGHPHMTDAVLKYVRKNGAERVYY